MSRLSRIPRAVVVLPPGANGRIADLALCRWLAKGRLQFSAPSREPFLQVLAKLGLPAPEHGLAALRLWGQTGHRPNIRVAAADPVYLEAMLNHVRLHALRPHELPPAQLWRLFESLQQEFGDDRMQAFASVGSCGYVRGGQSMATASVSAEMVHLAEPADFLPQGDEAVAHDRFIGEVQLFLHAHPVNEQRRQAGLMPINSLWIWGGGESPRVGRRDLLPLFSDDPLFTGYWHSADGSPAPWPASLETCLETAPDGFIAVCPTEPAAIASATLAACLDTLRVLLSRGDLARLTLLFRDGLAAELARHDAWRFWRRVPDILRGSDAL